MAPLVFAVMAWGGCGDGGVSVCVCPPAQLLRDGAASAVSFGSVRNVHVCGEWDGWAKPLPLRCVTVASVLFVGRFSADCFPSLSCVCTRVYVRVM